MILCTIIGGDVAMPLCCDNVPVPQRYHPVTAAPPVTNCTTAAANIHLRVCSVAKPPSNVEGASDALNHCKPAGSCISHMSECHIQTSSDITLLSMSSAPSRLPHQTLIGLALVWLGCLLAAIAAIAAVESG